MQYSSKYKSEPHFCHKTIFLVCKHIDAELCLWELVNLNSDLVMRLLKFLLKSDASPLFCGFDRFILVKKTKRFDRKCQLGLWEGDLCVLEWKTFG